MIALLLAATLAAAPAPATVRMRIDLAAPERAGRVSVTFVSLRDGTSVAAEQPVSAIDQLEQQTIAPGAYEMTIAADHHRSAVRRVLASTGATVNLGTIAVAPLPLLRGRVDAPGATVRLPNDDTRYPVTDGSFAIEIPAKMPAYVIVEAPHRGTRVVTVPPRNADVELAPVELPPPTSLDVVVRRPPGRHDAVDVLLGASAPNEAPLWFARRHLAGRAGSTQFASLAAGTYTLLVRGSGPLQQAATTTVLRTVDGNRSTIVIAPRTVETQVMLGGERVANATVKLIKGDYGWTTSLTTDAEGRWRGEAWQPGTYIARVSAPTLATTLGVPVTLSGSSTLALPAIAIRGHVVDAATGAPVPNAAIGVYTESDEATSMLRARTGADGRFELRSLPPGHQRVSVRAPAYLAAEDTSFALTEGAKELELRLDSGVQKEVTVVDGHGAAVSAARIACARDERIRSLTATDENGHAMVAIPREGCVLFAIPSDGPFAVLRVTPATLENEPQLTMTMPRSRASLAVATQTENGKPVAGVHLLVRFDGELLPPDVASTIERAQGLTFATDESGTTTLPSLPLGTYELWPYRTPEEAAQLVASGPMPAPVQLLLKTGENAVTMKFRAR